MLISEITMNHLFDVSPVQAAEIRIRRSPGNRTEFMWRWFGKNNQTYGFCHIARDSEAAEPVLDYCKRKMAQQHESSNH